MASLVLSKDVATQAAHDQGLGVPTDPKKTLKIRGDFRDLGELAAALPELRKLDISEVPLERLPSETLPPQLTFLKAIGCNLENIALSVSDLGSLEELTVANLGNNNISSLPASTMQKCKKLAALVLNNNKLREVTHIGHLTSLNTLVLSHNRIDRMPKSLLGQLPQLAKLSLSGNQLTKFPSVWMCEGLTELRLAGNSIVDIPAKVSRLTKLRLIDLSNNQLQSFDDMAHLSKCERLSNVSFRGNPLSGSRASDSAGGEASVDAAQHARYQSQVSVLLPHVTILDGNRLVGNARGKRGQAAPAAAVAHKRRRQGLEVDEHVLQKRAPKAARRSADALDEEDTPQEQVRVLPGQHPGVPAAAAAGGGGSGVGPIKHKKDKKDRHTKKDKKDKKTKRVVTDIHTFAEDPGEAPAVQEEGSHSAGDSSAPQAAAAAAAATQLPALSGAVEVTDEAAKNARRHKKDKKPKKSKAAAFVPAVSADAGVGLMGAAGW